MRGRLGGRSSPKLPEVVNSPRENLSGYFSLIRAGKSRPPKAIMVTPDAPVNAVKRVQAKRATTANPPGNHPRNALESLTRRFGAWLSAST